MANVECDIGQMQNYPDVNITNIELDNVVSSTSLENNPDLDLYQVIDNPDKFDDNDSDNMLNSPTSNYYSVNKINHIFDSEGSKALSLFHCNIRSLAKNLNLLNEMRYSISKKLDVIAITETRLNLNSVTNVDMPGYNFFHVDSVTNAGGAGLYVSEELKCISRPDLVIDINQVESCWVEIETKQGKNIIIGSIYRHPKGNVDQFAVKLDEMLKYLNVCKYQVYLLGDINIDFFKFAIHNSTEAYLDMLYANNFLPIITKPTRLTDHSKTLTDHIYTNAPIDNIIPGIGLFELSDHLPVFCLIKMEIKRNKERRYYRDYNAFNEEAYLNDLNLINWNSIINGDNGEISSNLNIVTVKVVDTLTHVVNKHAPIKLASRSKNKLLTKPWITNGILKSIKTKQKMYYTHFLSNNINKKCRYKAYANKLNIIKNKSKTAYYKSNFEMCKNNLKATWKLIGTLIKRKAKGLQIPTRLIRNNKTFLNSYDIANEFNEHFANVGLNLASKIPNINDNPTKFIDNSPTTSFVMSPVLPLEVMKLFKSLNENKASLNIPNKLIKIASSQFAIPFTYIYNQSIKMGIVPDLFKIPRITPIYKSGILTDPNNYRPISILSPFSKIFERIVYDQLLHFLEKNNFFLIINSALGKGILPSRLSLKLLKIEIMLSIIS